MKFYSDIEGNRSVWDGSKLIPFIDGVIETTDPAVIELLRRCGYREGEANGQAQQGNTKRQTAEKEQTDWSGYTKNELVKELVKRGIDFNKRQNKDELIKLLGGD